MEEQKDSATGPCGDLPPPEAISTPSSEDEVEELVARAEEYNRERAQFRELAQRAQADLANYRRRAEEEREELAKYANSRLILKILPVLDDFALAVDHAGQSGAAGSWLEGIKLIQRKLDTLLDSESVSRIEAEGREFDPVEHEALAYQESADHHEGQIVSVVRQGYKLQGRVIRPALVILAKKPETKPEDNTPVDEPLD